VVQTRLQNHSQRGKTHIHEDDPKHQTLIKIVEIEAFLPGISVYEDTYKWSGEGQEGEPRVISEDHTLIGLREKKDWNCAPLRRVHACCGVVPPQHHW
jgi:hypothetical protein